MSIKKQGILVIILAVLLTVGLSVCSQLKNSTETPEEAVAKTLEAIKAGEASAASKYIDYDEWVSETKSEESENSMAQIVFSHLGYEIVSSSINGDEATVNAKITNVDMGRLMDKIFETAMHAVANAPVETEEEIDALLLQIYTDFLNRTNNRKLTKTVEIPLSYIDENWKINLTEDFIDILFGGMISASRELKMEK